MSKQSKKKKLNEPKHVEDNDALEENKEFTTIEEFWRFEDALTTDERRARYHHGDYYTLQDITAWANYVETIPAINFKEQRDHVEKLVKSWELLPEPEEWDEDNSSDSDSSSTGPRERVTGPRELVLDFEPNEELNSKISLWRGDITKLEIDAVVNAANESLLGGGGIDGAIHAAAGPTLVEECAMLHGCSTGNTKITRGHKLPAKFILHTVGPRCYNTITKLPVEKLQRCYTSCLSHVSNHKLKSVAFCCISTGIFSYPNEAAAFTAVSTIRDWLTKDDNYKRIDRVIFCVFEEKDLKIYEQMMQVFFPPVRHSKNVQLPCYFDDRWTKIKKFVKKNNVGNIDELCKFIREFSPEQSLDLSNFKLLFDKLGDSETADFFSKTLPTILKLAVRIEGICQEEQRQHDLLEDVRSNTPEYGAIPLLVHAVKNNSVTLSQEKIASLVACAFLCLLPQQKFHNQVFASPNFKQLYAKVASSEVEHVLPNQANKLRCLMHYFNRINESMPEGFVKIERRNFTSPMEKLDRQDQLSTAWHLPVIFNDTQPHAPKQQEDGVVLLDSNELPASTFLSSRDVISPAEVFCLTNPELTILPLITSQLVNWESIEVRGSETFCECSVDKAGRNFRFMGDYKDNIKKDNRLKKRTLIFINSPKCRDKMEQLKRHNILIEYHNIYSALMPHIRDRTISVFYGDGGYNDSIGTDLQLKTMLLLIAIHAIGCKNNAVNEVLQGSKDKIKAVKNQTAPVLLHLSNYAYIEQFIGAINVLKKEEVSSWHFVERIWTDFIEQTNEDLFARIKSRFKGWKKEAKQLHKKKDKDGKQKVRPSVSIPRRKTDMGTTSGQHKTSNTNATGTVAARSSTGLSIFSPRTQKSERDLKRLSVVDSNSNNKSDLNLAASGSRKRGTTIDTTADLKRKEPLETDQEEKERKEKSRK